MRPVSRRFLAAVSSTHRIDVRARVVTPGLNGVNPPPADVLATLNVIDGSVTLDSTADVYATLSLTITPDSWPTDASSPVTPYGNEIFVERGVVYGDGTREWVSLGYFRIDSVEQDDAPLGNIVIEGSDRSAGLKDQQLVYPRQYTAGTTALSVVEDLTMDIYPWLVIDYDPALLSTLVTDQVTTNDRFGFLHDLIASYGLVMRFDYRGVLWIHFPPTTARPVATLKTGRDGVLISVSRTLARDGIYNGVLASGEQVSDAVPPVSYLAYDNDPTSPTYWFGPFGQVPYFLSSSTLTDPNQCQVAAQSWLQQNAGLPYNLDFQFVPNPALEPLDPISVQFPGSRDLHIISQETISLQASGAMTGQTRQAVRSNFS